MNIRIRSRKRPLVLCLLLAVLATVAAAAGAPYLEAELSPWKSPHAIIDTETPRLTKGRMVDDYFAVEAIDAATFAIGEPRYYQQNYSYLLVGATRALLFDAGSGTRDISKVVASLTTLPVTVLVSHLHYDHLGGIAPFTRVAMLDVPATRKDVIGGRFVPGRYEYLGLIDRLQPPSVQVTDWLAPGSTIDLGGRVVTLLSTPGHTPTSVTLVESPAHRVFIGDFIYPTTIYAFLPGASLSAYQETAERLLTTLPADSMLWTAHCCRRDEGVSAPWLVMSDLRDLRDAIARVRSGGAPATGFYPRRYPVSRQMTIAIGFRWNNR